MLKLMFISIVSMTFFGCATYIPMTYKEQCAQKGLKLSGVTSSNGAAIATAGGHLIAARSNDEAVSCVAPEKPEESCEIDRLNEELGPKVEYNRSAGNYRLLTGIGYVLYVVPGIGMKLYSDSKMDKAIDASDKIADQNKNKCTPKQPENMKAENAN